MNICRIVKIAPDGKPWGAPPNGPYYPFYITFADGTAGQANAKTNPPAYKEGDEVGYEITGATPRGVPKLKIDRKADPAFCTNTTPQDHHPDLEAAPQAQKPPYNRPAAQPAPQPPRGLEHYTALYSACIGAAGNAIDGTDLAGDLQALRQVATAFFIQGLRDGITVDSNVPF